MSLRNLFRRQTEAPTLRDRAADLRASLPAPRHQQSPTPETDSTLAAAQEPVATADPIFDAIAAHVAARDGLEEAAPGIDRNSRLQKGLDASDEAMAAARAAWDAANESEVRTWNAIFETRPTTLAGVLAVIRHARQWASENYGVSDALPLEDMFEAIAEGLARVMEAEAVSSTLVRKITEEWAAWGLVVNEVDDSTESTATWEQADVKRDRLLHAAMALPATPENIAAKALACAWMEWVCVERPGHPRDAYGPADQLVYDIHATIMAQGAAAAQPATFVNLVAQAEAAGDVLAASGVDHRDGTVSFASADGNVVRLPMAHWIAFNAQQMHGRVQAEMGRRAAAEASHLSMEDRAAWDAKVRCDLRSDAIHALAFRHLRVFEAANALRSGAEPTTSRMREESNAELLALAPLWEAAMDLYQQRINEEHAVEASADKAGLPAEAPEGTGPEWQAWIDQKEGWRERTGIAAVEKATSEAGTALYEIEVRIANLPAASLAGLKLKARVAQASDDIEVDWPENLGAGLARDILALTEARASRPDLGHGSLAAMLDLAGATMGELQAIRTVADHIGSTAYAHLWGPRCRRRQNAYGAPEYNAAGELAVWIGDALTSVESAVHAEARRREPANDDEREKRLSLLAVTIIDNGDPADTAAFARELLASVER